MQAESWTCHNSQLYVPFYPCSTTMCLSEAVGRQPVCREVQCPRNVSSYQLHPIRYPCKTTLWCFARGHGYFEAG